MPIEQLTSGCSRRSSRGTFSTSTRRRCNCKTGKGYVWVFTSLEEVVFMYRPTREGDFLRELLKDFRGVLVSDFYTAYDSIDVPATEVPHPPDAGHEPRAAEQPLRRRTPVDIPARSVSCCVQSSKTIDEHGLKRRHLIEAQRDVEGFFASIVRADLPLRGRLSGSMID